MKNKYMKKILSVFTLICIFGTLLTLYASAAPSMSVSGPSTVRAGDTISVTFKVNGEKTNGVELFVKFDASQLTYSSYSASPSGWRAETANDGKNGSMKFIIYDDQQTNPLNGSKDLFTVKFKVSSNLETGTSVSVKATDIAMTDGENETTQSSAAYSVKITAPISTDCTLSSLSIDGVQISPAFSASKTEYTASVDYTVSSVKVTAKASDSKAKVSVSGGSSLKVGKNTVTVTVTAESGAKKTYSIVITKSDDPNKPSSDSTLKKLTPSTGTLSPKFSAKVTKYTVTVPYDTTKITLDGEPNDSKATVKDAGGTLKTGETVFTVVCTAEDGTSTKYRVTVIRMPEDNASVTSSADTDPSETTVSDTTDGEQSSPVQTDEQTVPVESDTDFISDTEFIPDTEFITESTDTAQPQDTDGDVGESGGFLNMNVKLWTVILIALASFMLGAGCGIIAFKR